MARFLLIHGSCHGAWCWRDLIPLLEARGHRVQAIDLPSHGDDTTPLEEVTLDLYAQSILDALAPDTVLVGHSMAGYPITRAADLDPSRIARLVYLCAYTPWPEVSLIDMRKKADRQPIMKALVPSQDRKSFSVNPAHAAEVFYHDCSDATIAFACAHVCPQAILPQATGFTPGPHVAALPKDYIVCRNDGAVPAEFQDVMAQALTNATVYEMATSHSPFFSDPAGLAALLDYIASSPTTES